MAMAQELPAGWIRATLGDITRPSRVGVDPNDRPGAKFVGLEHIESGTMRLLGHGLATDVRSRSLAFSEGDVLYSRMRPYLNKVWTAEFGGVCSGEFLVFPKQEHLHNAFLAVRINAHDFVEYSQELARGERPRVAFSGLSKFELLLPPLAEQRRIVEKLTAVLRRLRNGEESAARAQGLVDRYRQAVVESAVSGGMSRTWREKQGVVGSGEISEELARLGEERRRMWEATELRRLESRKTRRKSDGWRTRYPRPVSGGNDPLTPDGWASASIDELSWARGYGTSVKCTQDGAGPPVIRIPNVRSGKLDMTDVKFATTQDFQDGAFVEPGDLLLVRTNGSRELIGRGLVLVRNLAEQHAFASYVIRYRLLGSHLLWRWVDLVWKSRMVRKILEGRAKTTAGQYNLSLATLSDVAIPLPPAREQERILEEVAGRFDAVEAFDSRVRAQMDRADRARRAIMERAFSGQLVAQMADEEPAIVERGGTKARQSTKATPRKRATIRRKKVKEAAMDPAEFEKAWDRTGQSTDARRLFAELGYERDEVVAFYHRLRETGVVLEAFSRARVLAPTVTPRREFPDQVDSVQEEGNFRIVDLWLEDFKNLREFRMQLPLDQPVTAILGWNGTGKSNLFEAIVMVFRDLHDWAARNRWPPNPLNGFRITYCLGEKVFKVSWTPAEMTRPVVSAASTVAGSTGEFKEVSRSELQLPRFIFGYYAGPTNRLAEHFLPMKQAHYERLRESQEDDPATLNQLLEKRRFFCAETHHAKYVLLAFAYREDERVQRFLAERLRIVGFESALFIVRKPRWARSNDATEFWGARGIMRTVMERLRRHAVAPMAVEQRISDGYRTVTEQHYYFYLPDQSSLQAFAAEYADARTFFLALESTDFSELIYDLKIQVRIQGASAPNGVAITFHELSEGEQQLLTVLGLMRFTQSRQSLVLLDEPDTHLNPHWSATYLADLNDIVGRPSNGRGSSQILLATHDPLTIRGLGQKQVQLLLRDDETGACRCVPASVGPRGLGVGGILTSEMFGFRSDLDEGTVQDLDERARLLSKEDALDDVERHQLEELDARLVHAGFSGVFSDPYYAAFVRAWRQRLKELRLEVAAIGEQNREEVDSAARRALDEVIADLGAPLDP